MEGRYQRYPEYKDSGVTWLGKVPVDWNKLRLKHVLSEKNKTSNPNLPAGSISFGNVIYKNEDNLAIETKQSYQEVLSGEFLINPLNMNFDLLSLRTALAGIDVVVSTGYIVLKSTRGLNKHYTRWLLQEFDVAHMKTLGSGVRQTINYTDIGNSFFYEPTAGEQTQIANFLDHETAKIDTLIEKQQQLIKLLGEKRQAVISHAVTKGLNPNAPMKDSGVEWLGEVPAHWKVAKLSYRYEVLLGKMLDDKRITGQFLAPYLRNTDVQWDEINIENLPEMDFHPDEKERYSVVKGDLLVCEGGEIGRCAIWNNEEPCCYQKALHRLRPLNKNYDTARYMFYALSDAVHQERFIAGAGKATIAHLPAETFRQYKFSYPPYSEQIEISIFLDEQNERFLLLEKRAEKQISLLQERRTALISAAVTGKIDVRNWKGPAPQNNYIQDSQ